MTFCSQVATVPSRCSSDMDMDMDIDMDIDFVLGRNYQVTGAALNRFS